MSDDKPDKREVDPAVASHAARFLELRNAGKLGKPKESPEKEDPEALLRRAQANVKDRAEAHAKKPIRPKSARPKDRNTFGTRRHGPGYTR